jgi:outer membrane protein TolC
MPLAGEPQISQLSGQLRLGAQTSELEGELSHHPQIAMLDRQADIAAAEARLAQANQKADWTVEVAFQQRGQAYSNMVSVGISLPLQWDRKHRQDRELAAKLATLEQARAEREEMLRAHIAETQSLVAEWQSGRERLQRYQSELLPLATQRTQAVLAAYRGGKASLADVLAARRGEIDTRLQALQLEADTARVWAQVNFLFPLASDDAARAAGQHKEQP